MNRLLLFSFICCISAGISHSQAPRYIYLPNSLQLGTTNDYTVVYPISGGKTTASIPNGVKVRLQSFASDHGNQGGDSTAFVHDSASGWIGTFRQQFLDMFIWCVRTSSWDRAYPWQGYANTYDSLGRVISVRSLRWPGPYIISETNLTYDTSGNLIAVVDNPLIMMGSSMSYDSVIYSYNTNNSPVFKYHYKRDTAKTKVVSVSVELDSMGYDGSGRLASYTQYLLQSGSLIPYNKTYYRYSGKICVSETTYQNSYGSGLTPYYLDTAVYKATGYISKILHCTWDTLSKTWMPVNKLVYKYDAKDRVVEDTESMWKGTGWDGRATNSTIYYDSIRAYTVIRRMGSNGVLSLASTTSRYFNQYGLIQGAYQGNVDTVAPPLPDGSTIYYYEVDSVVSGSSVVNGPDTTHISPNPTSASSISLYPNPASGILTVKGAWEEGNGYVTLSIVDMFGKEVFAMRKESASPYDVIVPIKQLQFGMYTLVVRNKKNISKLRFQVLR